MALTGASVRHREGEGAQLREIAVEPSPRAAAHGAAVPWCVRRPAVSVSAAGESESTARVQVSVKLYGRPTKKRRCQHSS